MYFTRIRAAGKLVRNGFRTRVLTVAGSVSGSREEKKGLFSGIRFSGWQLRQDCHPRFQSPPASPVSDAYFRANLQPISFACRASRAIPNSKLPGRPTWI